MRLAQAPSSTRDHRGARPGPASAAPPAAHGRYLPALDGLRALAVAAVIAYHLGFGWARGGYLGVDLFFVLSGFLITGLLVGERDRRGGVDLAHFYGRRARRLLPALYLLVAVVAVWVAAAGATTGVGRAEVRGDTLAALGYVANWRFVLAHQGYFAQFSVPSPLRHVWSLAIEEQFYLLWPAVLLVVLRLTRGSRRSAAAVTAAMAVASCAAMAVLYHPGGDPSRVYYGTDTRAFELLAGAVLALTARLDVMPARPHRAAAGTIAGALGLGVLGLMVATVSDAAGWMYRGGFALAALLAAVAIWSVSRVRPGRLAAALSVRPLRWIGQVSYGLYLWHWPAIDLLTRHTTGLSGNGLRVVQVGVALAACTASYYLIERPVRQGRVRGRRARIAAPASLLATVTVVLAATVPAVASPSRPVAAGGRPAAGGGLPAATTTTAPPAPIPPALGFVDLRTPSPAAPLRVLVVGDSVMWDASLGIQAGLQATGAAGVDIQALLGFGLSRSSYPWRSRWPVLLRADHPDLVIGLLGSWDWDAAEARGAAWYAGLVDEATRMLVAGGAHVLWLEYPLTDQPDIPGKAPIDRNLVERERSMVNAGFAQSAAAHPGWVAYLPVGPVLDDQGQFTSYLPGPDGSMQRVRKHDGVHICPAGAARLGQWVLQALTPAYALPTATPGWQGGAWTVDGRYDTPAGACS